MPSRGTLGMRMSRLRVDGLLNNTVYWRAFPSDTQRYGLLNVDWPVTTNAYVLFVDKAVPAGYLPGSLVRVKRDIRTLNASKSIYSILTINGVQQAATLHISASTIYQTVYDEISVVQGDVIGCYQKMDDLIVNGRVDNFKICCGNEGVIESVGKATW